MEFLNAVFSAIGFLSVIAALTLAIKYVYESIQRIYYMEKEIKWITERYKKLDSLVIEHEKWIKKLEEGIRDMQSKEKP